MILSNVSIHEALDKKWLVISPEPAPRKKLEATGECPYQTSAVDLTLGDEIAYLKKEPVPIVVDLRLGGFAALFGPHSESKRLTPEQPFILKPNQFVLGKTRERVELPIIEGAPCLAARVEGESSYARCGLLVHFTAPTIHAGFSGTITLELLNLGPLDILLASGAPICQLIVEQVHGLPFRNDSQFQDQRHAGGRVESSGAEGNPHLP